ncbi:MAG TPA: 50S ribosomal protein L17 [Verrucomicrobia bacterium]|nr:50S ribosomal protein L17 [Verrucomicrobiota bacterium]
MRHRKNTVKLGRTSSQREALFASLVSNLILAKRIQTTLPKARAARRMADKMVTVGKKETLAARRLALSRLKQEKAVAELFSSVAPAMKDRQGGYTRIIKLGKRMSDSSEMCILEWVDFVPKAKKAKAKKEEAAAPADEKKAAKTEKKAEKPAKKPAAKKAKKDEEKK